jgi:hypothetical protein
VLTNAEISLKLRTAADTVQRIGKLIGHERAVAACQESSAILAECANEFTPAAPSPAKQHAAAIAARAKPNGQDE